jgi:NAD(P)-dependent dehydrogenase (short-subunit alcohol dehydrogenase family)
MGVSMFELKGKKALVTGGSVGVGRACATALALAGADVALVGRAQDRGERACSRLKDLGVDAVFVKCDVTQASEVDAMMRNVVDRFGRLDIAVNNAGGGTSNKAIDMELLDWDATVSVNLTAVFCCARAQARQMAKQAPVGGKIINIASIYASIAGGSCSYNASKAAVVHLTRSLAAEWGGANININCVSPGWMLTPGNWQSIGPGLRARMREVTPMGSLLRYEDLYGAIIYLASSASDFVTGHDLVVDGGHTVNTWLAPLQRSAPARTLPEQEEAGLRGDLNVR